MYQPPYSTLTSLLSVSEDWRSRPSLLPSDRALGNQTQAESYLGEGSGVKRGKVQLLLRFVLFPGFETAAAFVL